jgi:hypothetical protein
MVSGNQPSDIEFSCTPQRGRRVHVPRISLAFADSQLGLHMGNIGRQGIGTVKTLPGQGRAWQKHAGRMEDDAKFTCEADALHPLLMRRADDLADSSEGSAEAAELAAIVDAIEAYAGKRWPLGKVPAGKG